MGTESCMEAWSARRTLQKRPAYVTLFRDTVTP